MITCSHLTPAQANNQNITVTYGINATPFGACLIGLIEQNICHLSFFDDDQTDAVLIAERLKRDWPTAQLTHDQKTTKKIIKNIFSKNKTSLKIVLKGTPFQIKVWETLLAIPCGSTVSYQEVATKIGNPKAHRAAASAIAKNSIAYLVPCHRVIKKTGEIHRYRWGTHRKKMILSAEKAT